jgi:hypothetical protein
VLGRTGRPAVGMHALEPAVPVHGRPGARARL